MAQLKAASDFGAPRAKVWEFASDSNPDKSYQTILYVNGTASCNCPGWTRHKAAGGGRTCRHIASIEMGRADETCAGSNDYRLEGLPEAVTAVLKTNHETAQAKTIKFGSRKLSI
jgi:hypothetical protein